MAVQDFYFFGSYNAFRPFILTVDSGADARYTIPTIGTGYNYSVNTSDGQFLNGVTGNQLIIFPLANTLYDIEIRGLFPRIYINNNAERLKGDDIKQWGDIVMGANQVQSYYNASNVTCTATDSPDMLLVTNGQSMFQQAIAFNPPNFAPTLDDLTNGLRMFRQATSFNPPNFAPTLANLTNGEEMFYLATDFNPPNFAPTLDVLTIGASMFRELPNFNPPNFAPTLDVLTNGANMFRQTTSFNPPNFAPTLENLTNGNSMFRQATNFAQEIYAPNSIHLTDDSSMFSQTKIAKITMNNTALTTTDALAFQCPLLTDLILIDRKIDLTIRYSPLLTGTAIDNLAGSVADLTGFPTKNVTMTLAQRASCNQSLWTNKNWTIIAV